MDVFIGLDLGTSAVKGALIAEDGTKIALGKRTTSFIFPKKGYVEISPSAHYENLASLLTELSSKVPKGARIAAVSMSAASGNLILMDRKGNPVSNILSWLDGRAIGKAGDILPGFDTGSVHRVVGWPYAEGFPLAHLAWMKSCEPGLFKRAERIGMNSDWLLSRLTGSFAMDPSTATTFYLQDQLTRTWYKPHLELLGISEAQLPKLAASGSVMGTITTEASRDTGIPEGTPVVLGSFDHPSAARGTGVLEEGTMLLSCGTSWVGFYPSLSRDAGLAQSLLIDPFRTPEGPWGMMFSLPQVGKNIDFYVDTCLGPLSGGSSGRYKLFDGAAAEVEPGSGGLAVNPIMEGYEEYIVKLAALKPHGLVSRALMEGTAYEFRKRVEGLSKAGFRSDRAVMVGGPSESPIWPSIVADVLGMDITLINGQTAGAVGAAVMASVGVGRFKSETEAFKALGGEGRVIRADEKRHRIYEGFFQAR